MKTKISIVTLLFLASFACNNAGKPVAETNTSTTAPASNSEKPQTAIAHSLEKQTPPTGDAAPSGAKSKWTQGGDPIDTKELDAAIKSAETALIDKPNDPANRKAMGDAYFKRAEALKDARQYASALGDYRRALKHDPSNAQAKNWIDQIIMIYDSLGRESPPEGQEPPPLKK